MQFSHAIFALVMSTAVVAAPEAGTSKFEKRATAVDYVTYAIGTLGTTVDANVNALTSAAASVGGDASAQVTIIATYNADIQAIVTATNSAAATIAANTVAGVTTLSAPLLQVLTGDIAIAAQLIASVSFTLTTGANEFVQATKNAVASEVVALEFAVAALAAPLNTYANAVIANSQYVGAANINALQNAIATFNAATSGFIAVGSLFAPVPATSVGGGVPGQ